MTDISLKTLLETNAHFGHQIRRWNPKMAEYLYGQDQGIHIFDLTKTKVALESALEFLRTAKKENKLILLLGTKKQAKNKLAEIALATGLPYVNERFLGGTITNFEQIKKSISKLSEMSGKMASGDYNKYTKKERLLIKREIDRLERFFGGMKNMARLPDILFIVDTHKEMGAVKEATAKGITIVGIVDSNSDPNLIDYPIPMNDDSSKAVDYVLDLVQDALTINPKSTDDKKVVKVKKPKVLSEVKEKVVSK